MPGFPADLSAKAARALRRSGVTVRTDTQVTNIDKGTVTMRHGDATDSVHAHTILWTAGVKAPDWGRPWRSTPGRRSIAPGG